MKVLIPMAGEGNRFKEEGYSIPKPLIPTFDRQTKTELPMVVVCSDREIMIEIKNWQYKNITMGISDLVDPDIATKTIEHYRDEKTRKIDSLLVELGKETSILEEIEAKIKEFGIEENND